MKARREAATNSGERTADGGGEVCSWPGRWGWLDRGATGATGATDGPVPTE